MTRHAWAGWFSAAGAPMFVQVEMPEIGGEGPVSDGWKDARASLPRLGWFHVPALVDNLPGHRMRLSFTAAGLTVRFDGETAASRIAGVATVDGRVGRFELQPAAPLDESVYRRFVSHFAGAGRAVSLHLQTDTFFGEAMAVYLEKDEIVRLHPISGHRLLSERAELLELHDGSSGAAFLTVTLPGQPAAPERLENAPRWHEERVEFPGPAGRLAGTLMTPPTGRPHAAVALVHGAAGGRRDFYRVFGEQFTRAGLAALIYDKRGHGESEAVNGDSTMLDRSRDAAAALTFLQSRPGITAAGLYGFSNGAWSVPMVSGPRHDVGFVVVMGAPGVTPARAEVHRKVFELREQGVPEPECHLAATVWELIYLYRQTGAWDDSDSELFDHAVHLLRASQALAGVRLQQYAIDNPLLSPIPPYRSHQDLLQDPPPEEEATEWSYDPVPDYRRTVCPVLYTVGELDQNVPGPESAERVAEALTGPAHRDSIVRLFPATGHLMNVVGPTELHGMTSEEASYRFHRFRFAPGFLELLRSWTHTRAQRAKSS